LAYPTRDGGCVGRIGAAGGGTSRTVDHRTSKAVDHSRRGLSCSLLECWQIPWWPDSVSSRPVIDVRIPLDSSVDDLKLRSKGSHASVLEFPTVVLATDDGFEPTVR